MNTVIASWIARESLAVAVCLMLASASFAANAANDEALLAQAARRDTSHSHANDMKEPKATPPEESAHDVHEDMPHSMHEQESEAPPPTGDEAESQAMEEMDMSSMQGGKAPPDARSPDYSEGHGMSPMPGMEASMNDDATVGKLLVEELEWVDESENDSVELDAQGYLGRDENKLWVKADGEHSDGRLRDLRTEVLWAHAWRSFWDTELGLRQDFGEGPERTWVAAGVQGLAPYWFEVEATLYVGSAGRTAARLEAEYDLRLTQRLILTPDLELNAYGKDDPGRLIGSGVSNVEFGLRLRYEIRRQFAPYVGFNWNRRLNETADLYHAAGESAHESSIVAGLRIWF